MLEIDNEPIKPINQPHYTHFLLTHSKELIEFSQNIIIEYYEEEKIIRRVFKESINTHYKSKYSKEWGIGPADVVETKEFLYEGLVAYQKKYN